LNRYAFGILRIVYYSLLDRALGLGAPALKVVFLAQKEKKEMVKRKKR
jgi:hypothetical protein